jgi:hypothetical protein
MRRASIAAIAGAVVLAVGASSATAAPNQAAGQVNQGNLISALNNVAVQIGDVTALNDLTIEDVQVVNVEDVLNNSNVLNNVLRDANVQVLQDFLNNSLNDNVVIIRDVLSNNLVAISDVIAVNVLSGGDVIVFAQ